MTRIYLSRHGQTLVNAIGFLTNDYTDKRLEQIRTKTDLEDYLESKGKSIEELKELTRDNYEFRTFLSLGSLTERGRFQAQILGSYLSGIIKPGRAVYITSELERSKESTEIAAAFIGDKLTSDNHLESALLNERVPKQFIYGKVKNTDDDEILLPELDMIGQQTVDEFKRLARRCKGRPIVSVLHGALNSVFLKYVIDKDDTHPLADFFMDNCGLADMRYRTDFRIVSYTQFIEMEDKVKHSLIARAMAGQ